MTLWECTSSTSCRRRCSRCFMVGRLGDTGPVKGPRIGSQGMGGQESTRRRCVAVGRRRDERSAGVEARLAIQTGHGFCAMSENALYDSNEFIHGMHLCYSRPRRLSTNNQLHQHRTAATSVIISICPGTAQGLTFQLFPPCFSFDGDSPKSFDRNGQEK